MILFIITLILAAIGIAILGKGKVRLDDGHGRSVREVSIRPVGLLVLGVAALTLIFNIFTIVPTRNIAVSMAFGKPTGTLGNGFHLIAPWESTEEYDASIQTLKLDGDDPETPAPTVRLANAATARVDVTVQWQIDPNADITQLHLDYRNFENIQDNVVKRQLQAALNAVFEGYDPLVAIKGGQAQTTLAELGERVAVKVQGLLPKGIIVRSVTVAADPLRRQSPGVAGQVPAGRGGNPDGGAAQEDGGGAEGRQRPSRGREQHAWGAVPELPGHDGAAGAAGQGFAGRVVVRDAADFGRACPLAASYLRVRSVDRTQPNLGDQVTVKQYRKKPVVVEAVQFRGNFDEIEKFVGGDAEWRNGKLVVATLEGPMWANHGDWIIKGVAGEFYPCKAGIFAQTYELVADEDVRQLVDPTRPFRS